MNRVTSTAESFSARGDTSGRGPDERKAFERLAEDVLAVDTEVRREDLLIHRAEVHAVGHVLRRVELRQARALAVEAALHRVADEDDLGRGALVGPAARRLLPPAAAIPPRRDHDPVGHAVGGEVLME